MKPTGLKNKPRSPQMNRVQIQLINEKQSPGEYVTDLMFTVGDSKIPRLGLGFQPQKNSNSLKLSPILLRPINRHREGTRTPDNTLQTPHLPLTPLLLPEVDSLTQKIPTINLGQQPLTSNTNTPTSLSFFRDEQNLQLTINNQQGFLPSRT